MESRHRSPCAGLAGEVSSFLLGSARPRSLALGLALCLSAGAPAAQEQETGPDERATAPRQADAVETARVPASDPREKKQKRVLHLQGGDTLRGRAVYESGVWLVDRKGSKEPLALPEAIVLRVDLERELLAEAKRQEKQLGRKPTGDERVGYATWLLSRGLTSEAMTALDRVLVAEPDHAAALDLLERAGPRVALPPLTRGSGEADAAALAEWNRAAARLSPAGRELALNQLRDAGLDPIALQTYLRSELGAQTANRRAFAVVGLRRLSPGKALEPLAQRAVFDGSEDVRREAAIALGAADRPELVLSFVKLLGSDSPIVRNNAGQALGNMGYASAVAPLMGSLVAAPGGYKPPAGNIFVGSQQAYVQDYDVEVAAGSSIAKPIVNVLSQGVVLDARVLSSSTVSSAVEKANLRTSLSQLTGASPGHSTSAWKKWWAEHEGEWVAKGKQELYGEPKAPVTGPESSKQTN